MRFLRGGVCEDCWRAVPDMLAAQRCRRCAEALAAVETETCGRCTIDPPEFDLLRAAAPYAASAREILLAFKFRGGDFLAARIAALMVARLGAPHAHRVVAAPGRRTAQGGYSPSLLLATAVASTLALPFVSGGIERVRPARRQSATSPGRRAENVRGAFRAAPLSGDVLLVDDVATSGATARECARVLRRAGAENVEVWCFARASRIELAAGPTADA